MWFESKHLPGLGRLMRQQSDDERQHGLRILDHMLLRRVDLLKIDIDKMVPEFNPDIKQWNDAVDVASSVEAFENMMSERLIALVRAARESGDVETEAFLMPLVSEQTAETSETIALVEKIKTFSVMPGLIYHLDTQV
jgi:ferritin